MAVALQLVWPGVFAAPVKPDTGTAMEGAKPPAYQQPAKQGPVITVEGQQSPVQEESGLLIPVRAVRFGGELPVAESKLQELVQPAIGKEITLGELQQLSHVVTQYLRKAGYMVAFAYVPAQNIKNGIVEIRVVPGTYGQVKVVGEGHIDSDRLVAMLAVARSGRYIQQAALERALLLMQEISGIHVNGTLTPGTVPGTADLTLTVVDAERITGVVYVDNWGNSYTGQVRYGVQTNINNVSGNGDGLSIGVLTTGQGLTNYNVGYSGLLGHEGARFEVKHSRVDYTLGDVFAALDATGNAEVTSYNLSYPLVKKRDFSLYASLGYDTKTLLDDTISSHSPKNSQLWNLGLAGSFVDSWGGGGANGFSVTHSRGSLAINDATALANDLGNTTGTFQKTLITYRRQQYLAKNLNLNLNVVGQLASKNLDSSEKLFLGGSDGVRAFAQGEAAGDQGYRLTGECSWWVPGLSDGKNNLYLNAFYDYGSVMVNKNPYGTGANRRSLMGAGLGIMWTQGKDMSVRLDYAWKIGEEEDTAGTDKNGRFWVHAIRYF